AEKGVRMLGLKDIRVRTSGNAAILETLPSQKDVLEENKDEVEDILLKYYDSITYAERKPGL
ncbi:MAG: TIGR00268 family protein, partial [Candidatus Methanomethylophilaceae archaeon]|nr:TIGR00268 family protein [Candidatus Methanomethylophilaceae archaeon]